MIEVSFENDIDYVIPLLKLFISVKIKAKALAMAAGPRAIQLLTTSLVSEYLFEPSFRMEIGGANPLL